MPKIQPVILSGGSGKRLWPISRALFPKQLLSITGDNTLLQETALRLKDQNQFSAPMIICNQEHRFIVAEQCRLIDVEPSQIILEHKGRNTAPAAALAALTTSQLSPNQLILLLPSDHLWDQPETFMREILSAVSIAEKGYIVTFGVQPKYPETGYGYIEIGSPFKDLSSGRSITRFIEKPDAITAKKCIDSKNFLWNSGVFLFRADSYLSELDRLAPKVGHFCRKALEEGQTDLGFLRPKSDLFSKCPTISIDYAVMEKTEKAAVVPVDSDWVDVGSWSTLRDISIKDKMGNALLGDVFTHNVQNSIIHSDSRFVTVIGLKNVIVAETADAVLVADLLSGPEIKRVVEKLEAEGRSEIATHTVVHRPWGTYETVSSGPTYQVKRIVVNPKGSISLQKHYMRSEHWVVIEGKGTVTFGPDLNHLEVRQLNHNQSIDIPIGWLHRLENPYDHPLMIIEVQSGNYLHEDDIERYSDVYGRE